MIRKLLLITTTSLLFALLNTNQTYAQGYKIFRARQLSDKGQFQKAKSLYDKALIKDSLHYQANIELGNLYLESFQQFDSAYYYLHRGINNISKDTIYDDFFNYANALRLIGKYDLALENFHLFENSLDTTKAMKFPLDSLLNTYTNYCKIAKQMEIDKSVISSVENMDFFLNTKESEYTSVYFEEDSTLMFNARYKDLKKEKQYMDNQYMENIYIFDFNESVASTYDEDIEQENHQAIVSRIPNTDSVIVFYHNFLWVGALENERLGELSRLPETFYEGDFYCQRHGIYNTNKDLFIFSGKASISEDLDLFYSIKDEQGNWSTPVPFGPNINTAFDEDSPFLSANDSTLYFSSKGHHTSGDYDIYKSQKDADGWSTPEPLPYPINSPGEDIYFVLNSGEKYGYLSSNRSGGLGMMDIYTVYLTPVPDFSCPPFENPSLLVTMDITESLDSNSVDLEFNWKFEDGTTAKGEVVEKDFETPGEHFVAIDIYDIKGGQTEVQEVTELVVIDSVNFIGFDSEPYYYMGDTVVLDASVSYMEGYELTNFYWMVRDSILPLDSKRIRLPNLSAGEHDISLQIFASDGDNLISFCQYDTIRILTQSETDSVTKSNTDTDIIAVNDSDQDLSDTNQTDNNNDSDQSQNDNNTSDNDHNNSTSADSLMNSNGVVNISFEPIYFGFDKAYLTKTSTNDLDKLAQYLLENNTHKVIIVGHTDAMGSEQYNILLSQKRTKSTVNYLNNKGIKSNRIFNILNKGESDPAMPNIKPDGTDNPQGRKKNRRVEFIIIKPKQ